MMFTRTDLSGGKCSYQEYIFQFVTPELKQCVTEHIPLQDIIRADTANDIAHDRWTKAAVACVNHVAPMARRTESSVNLTLLTAIVQAAAFQMRKDAKFLKSGSPEAGDYMAAHRAMKACLAKAMMR